MSYITRFNSFEQKVAYKEIDINGLKWEYMDIGNPNGKAIVFLPGGLKHPIWSFSILDLLLEDYRIIAPIYPSLQSLETVIDGVKYLIEQEKLEGCMMMGSSWGGNMVQCITYKYPDLAEKIILSNTGALYSKALVPLLRFYLWTLRFKKRENVLRDYRKQLMKMLATDDVLKQFWEEILDRYYNELFCYDDYVTLIQNQIEYIENYVIKMIDKPRYTRPVLIFSSADETASTSKVRDKVKELYSNHTYYEFSIGGHAVALTNPEVYKEKVKEFFDK